MKKGSGLRYLVVYDQCFDKIELWKSYCGVKSVLYKDELEYPKLIHQGKLALGFLDKRTLNEVKK